MKKGYLMKGLAAAAVALTLAACDKKDDYYVPSTSESLSNAKEQLGSNIDTEHDWNMTASFNAQVTVNLGLDQEYTVGIYDENPLFSTNAHYYAKTTVAEGATAELSFEGPSAKTAFYVAVFDSKLRRVVQTATVADGSLNVVFGADASASRMTRATEAEFPEYAKTLNDFLNPTVETCAEFVSQNDSYKWMVEQNVLEVVDNTLSASTMHNYTAFTNADLDKQATLSNLIYEQGSQGTTTTETVAYKVPSGYDPASGTSVNLMNGSTKVGTLTFGDRVLGTAEVIESNFVWYVSNGQIFSINGGDNYKNEYGGGFGLDASHYITLNPARACSVAIEQSTATSNTLKLDNTELSVASATNNGSSRTYTVTGVSGGSHTISMGSGESGILKVTVTYDVSSTAISDPSYNFAWDGYTNRLARTYYRFTPEFDGTFTFYIKPGNVTVKDGSSYFKTSWGSDFNNLYWSNPNIDMQVEAGHTYEVTLNTADNGCYGVKMSYSVTTGGTEASSYYVGHGDGKHYRVAAGTEVTKKFNINTTYGKVNETVIYVEGKLHVGTDYTLNGVTIVVADGGELVIDGTANMSNAGRFVVMAGGKITGADNGIYNVNNGMPCYNAGTINYKGELNINGSNFYNCGTVNVNMLRNTSGGLITNFGSITARTNKDAADAYNCTFVNGCYMHYTEHAGIGHLTMLKNSRLDVDGKCEFNQSWTDLTGADAADPYTLKDATIANPNILMANSVVNVGTAFCNNTVFQGPSAAGEVAIVKMGKVQANNGTDLMQRQNCYFDWNITELYNHQDEKYQDIPAENKANNPYGYLVDYYRVHVTKFVSEATSPYTIPAGDCTGAGYNPEGNTDNNTGTPNVWSYAFEDTRVGDYDMNDVVIKVNESASNSNLLEITLCCTGASFDIQIFLGDDEQTSTKIFNGTEVHDIFSVAHGSFVNTVLGSSNNKSQATTTVTKPEGFSFENAKFWIKPSAAPAVYLAKEGNAPHAIVIPTDWQWPTEFTKITDAYPNFTYFMNDRTDARGKDWYNYPTSEAGKIYTE